MNGQRPPRVSRPSAPALLLGGAMLLLGAGVAAQDAVTGLARRATPTSSQLFSAATSDGPAALGIRGSTAAVPAAQGPPARAAARRPARPRTRQATAQPVRGGFRTATLAPDLIREVQPVFIPDVIAPLRLRKRPVELDPYAQVGTRVGNIRLFPAIEQDVGYDSNPNRTSGPQKGSMLLRTEGELRVQSDWSRHELAGFLRGAYTDYPNIKGADRPDGAGRLNLRLDASRDTQIDLETRYLVDTQRPGSPELNVDVRERPLVAAVGTSAGVTQRFNRLSLGLRGSVDRTVYEDARLTNGSILDQSDRDSTTYGLRLRAGYELKPGLTPFAEALLDTRLYDREIDRSGYRRSSDGVGARVGSTFEITRLVTGEASVGYQERHYEDERLKDLRGPLVDGAVIWSATPLTTVRLRGSTQIADTTVSDSPGALVSRATLEVQHDLRRNISLIGAVSIFETDYRGINLREDGYAASMKLDYRLTRSVALRASFTHERLNSTERGSDYTANVVLVGLRFQP